MILIFRVVLNMQQNQPIQFSGQIFQQQGAYFSSYTPQTIQQYLLDPKIPQHSYYHLVGCCNLKILATSNISSLLDRYITSSKSLQNTIIDLCLPFVDSHSGKVYMARYIIFRGKVLGIRLNTNSVDLWRQYSSWPKHKVKKIRLNINGQQHDPLIGQFYLHLFNARIGLLFSDQLKIRSEQYINAGFQIISIVHSSQINNDQTTKIINLISKNALLLQASIYIHKLQSQTFSIQNIARYFDVSNQDLEENSKVYSKYYSLEQIYCNKYFLHIKPDDLMLVQSLEIEFLLAQTKEQMYNNKSHTFHMNPFNTITKNNVLISQNKLINKQCNKDDILTKVFMKLSRLCHLQISLNQKIIIVLEQSIQTLTLCYYLNLLSVQNKEKTHLIVNKLKFIIIKDHPLLSTLNQLAFFQGKIESMRKNIKKESQDLNLLGIIKQINQGDGKQGEGYFILVSVEPAVANVVEMVNRNQSIKSRLQYGGYEDENSRSSFGKTWLVAEIFNQQQLQYLFERQIKCQFTQIQDYLTWIFKTQRVNSGYLLKQSENYEQNVTSALLYPQFYVNKQNLQLLRKDFNRQYQLNKSLIHHQKSKLFSHFIYRKIHEIPSSIFQNSQNLLYHILMTNPKHLLSVLSVLTSNNPTSTIIQITSHKMTLNKIINSRRQQMYMKKCHRCQFLYLPELVYECKIKQCREIFCYQCLMNMKCLEYGKGRELSSFQEIGKIKLCPICRNICNLNNCKLCKQKSEVQILRADCRQCSICMKSGCLRFVQCTKETCRKIVCVNCISTYYRCSFNKFQNQKWVCFCCKNECSCNRCQMKKRQQQFINNQLFRKPTEPKQSRSIIEMNCKKPQVQDLKSQKGSIWYYENNHKKSSDGSNSQQDENQYTVKLISHKSQHKNDQYNDQITQLPLSKDKTQNDNQVT